MSSVSLGKLYWELEMRLRDAEDTITRVDSKIVQADNHWDEMRANMARPIEARVNFSENSSRGGGGGGGSGGGVGAQLSSGGAGSSILPPRVDLTGSRGAGGGGALSAWAANPTMQAAYRGNPQAVAAAMAQQLGVTPGDITAIMTGGVPGGGGGGRAGQRQFYSAQGGPNLFGGARDALVQSYGLDALDISIPHQMRHTQEALKHDSEAAQTREDRREYGRQRREEFQMQKDMRTIPLSDQELRGEQYDRINAASAAIGGGGGEEEGGRGGNFLTRPLGMRGLRYTGLGIAAFGGLGIGNAYHTRSLMNASGNGLPETELANERQFQQGIQGSIPLVGGLAGMGADALGALGSLGKVPFFGRSMDISSAATNATSEEAARGNQIADLMKEAGTTRREDKFGISIANAGTDSFQIANLRIDKAFEDAKIAATDFGAKLREAGQSHETANAEVERQTTLAGKLHDAQQKQLDTQEKFEQSNLGVSTGVMGMRASGDAHGADRMEIAQHFDELMQKDSGKAGDYFTQQQLALATFDKDKTQSDSMLIGSGNAAAKAFGLQGQGQGFAASMVTMQDEQNQTMNRLARLFGTGSAEYQSANTRFTAQNISAYAQHDRTVSDYMGNSESASAISGFNANGDVYGAQHASLENERRHRLQFEAPGLADPRDPNSLGKVRAQINSEIDARDAAAKKERARSVDMGIADMNATQQGNEFAIHNQPITGGVVTNYDKFVNQYNNVQGSPEEQSRIKASMAGAESSELRLMQHNLEEGGQGHASRIEAGQSTHRDEDSRHFRDMAAALVAIQGMLANLGQGGGGNLNLFSWKGG